MILTISERGKTKLKGLPASFGTEEEVETLEIICVDSVLDLKVVLSYSVFEKEDIIARNVRLVNEGEKHLRIEKVFSACIDMDDEKFEMVTLAGSRARERRILYCTGSIRNGRSIFRGARQQKAEPSTCLTCPILRWWTTHMSVWQRYCAAPPSLM